MKTINMNIHPSYDPVYKQSTSSMILSIIVRIDSNHFRSYVEFTSEQVDTIDRA